MILKCSFMLYQSKLLKKNNLKWVRALIFYNKNLLIQKKNYWYFCNKFSVNGFFKNFPLVCTSNSTWNILELSDDDRFTLLNIFIFKNFNKYDIRDVFIILSSFYKFFMKKGFMSKIIKSITYSLKKVNTLLYNYFFFYHFKGMGIFDNFTNFCTTNAESASTEVYAFKNFDVFSRDIFIINDVSDCSMISQLAISSDVMSTFNTDSGFGFSNFIEISDNSNFTVDFNNFKGLFSFNIFFKYLYSYSVNKVQFKDFKNVGCSHSGYLHSIFVENYKNLSISFFNAYSFLLINNLKKMHFESSLNVLNNFYSVYYLIPKITSYLSFFFKIQFKSLSKRMRKILKNRRRLNVSYSYVKPNRRLGVSLYYLKKYLLLSDGRGLSEKLFNMFQSLAFRDNNSWVMQMYLKHQVECVAGIRYRRK